jgi:hypothetical protein
LYNSRNLPIGKAGYASANNMNATADAFDKQEPMLEIGDAPRITVGYLPNEFHTDMSVYMIHTKSHYENNWAIPISDLPVETTIELFKANDEQVSEQTRRVRAKAQASTHPPDEQFAQGKND